VELPLIPIFFSSAPGCTPGNLRFHQKRGELLAANFGEDRVQIGLAAIGDPHLLAVEDVALAIGRKIRAGLGGQRIGSGLRLAQTIGADHLR